MRKGCAWNGQGSAGSGVETGDVSTVEVVMRPPSVFVRPLQHEEAVRLKRLSRRGKHECTRQRAWVLIVSVGEWVVHRRVTFR